MEPANPPSAQQNAAVTVLLPSLLHCSAPPRCCHRCCCHCCVRPRLRRPQPRKTRLQARSLCGLWRAVRGQVSHTAHACSEGGTKGNAGEHPSRQGCKALKALGCPLRCCCCCCARMHGRKFARTGAWDRCHWCTVSPLITYPTPQGTAAARSSPVGPQVWCKM